MIEEKFDETIENAEEEEPLDKETSEEEPETSEPPGPPLQKKPSVEDELKEANRRLYARLKKEEERRKELEAKVVTPTKGTTHIPSDLDTILDVQSATRDLDANEITELKLRANYAKATLSEARKDPNFELWRSAYKAKLEKESVPEPSSRQSTTEAPKPLKDMTVEEKEAWLRKLSVQGKPFDLLPKWGNPPPPTPIPRV